MTIRDREQSIEQLSKALPQEKLSKAITQGYSDISLSVMVNFKEKHTEKLLDSSFSTDTINKLMEAYSQNKLSSDDLINAVNYSVSSTKNEPYVDDFLDSIDNGVQHETATKIFTAVNYENCSYKEALDYVKSGAFYPTENASLSVTDDVAKQLDEMGVKLRACEGFNTCYDVSYLKEAIDNGAAIFVHDKDLAVKTKEMMELPDWDKFRSEVKYIMGRDIDKLTGNILTDLRTNYINENNSLALYNKMQGEYNNFIDEIRSGTIDNAIQNAYQITAKQDIMMYAENETPNLTTSQYTALLSSPNTLHEVFEEWCDNGEYSQYSDIGDCLEVTADKIQISIDRNLQQKVTSTTVPKVEEKNEPVPELKQEQAIKPKSKSR